MTHSMGTVHEYILSRTFSESLGRFPTTASLPLQTRTRDDIPNETLKVVRQTRARQATTWFHACLREDPRAPSHTYVSTVRSMCARAQVRRMGLCNYNGETYVSLTRSRTLWSSAVLSYSAKTVSHTKRASNTWVRRSMLEEIEPNGTWKKEKDGTVVVSSAQCSTRKKGCKEAILAPFFQPCHCHNRMMKSFAWQCVRSKSFILLG